MPSRLISTQDGVLVEVEALHSDRSEISAFSAAQVAERFEHIRAVVAKVVPAIGQAFVEARRVSDTDIAVDAAEVKFTLGFTAEGSLFVAKGSTNASVELLIKFKAPQ